MVNEVENTLYQIYLSYSSLLLNKIHEKRRIITNEQFKTCIETIKRFKDFLLAEFPEGYSDTVKVIEYIYLYPTYAQSNEETKKYIQNTLNIDIEERKQLEKNILNSDAKRNPKKEIPAKYYQKPKDNLVKITTNHKNIEF